MQTVEQIKTLKGQVEYILAQNPITRNDDILLTITVRMAFHRDKLHGEYVALKDLASLPREDNIKRIRAKIQNVDKRFLPTSELVAKKRGINMEVRNEAIKEI